ncbi:Probable multidrug-efflux transporter Rv1634/MT1670 [Providencia stuartii]|nr:Probable multidrug-efflux transporter Rv1634/MT1670 [Providencia stuartii]
MNIEKSQQEGWRTLLTGKNLCLTLALSGGICLHAINVYITITTLPSVVRDIGGINFYAWNTTLFILSSIILSALTSRILNYFGPKKSYGLATLIFLVGSVICAITPLNASDAPWQSDPRGWWRDFTHLILLNGTHCISSTFMVESVSDDVEYVGNGNITRASTGWRICRVRYMARSILVSGRSRYPLFMADLADFAGKKSP